MGNTSETRKNTSVLRLHSPRKPMRIIPKEDQIMDAPIALPWIS